MRIFLLALTMLMLMAGCGRPQPTDTVESLMTNPERLKALRDQCKADRAKVGDELCNMVAEATRRRFFGDGKTPYTPPAESPKF